MAYTNSRMLNGVDPLTAAILAQQPAAPQLNFGAAATNPWGQIGGIYPSSPAAVGTGSVGAQIGATAPNANIMADVLSGSPTRPTVPSAAPSPAPTAATASGERAPYSTRFDWSMGPRRPGRPNQQITDALGYAAEQALGPGAMVRVTSGMGEHGSPRHREGHAADVQFIDAEGRVVTLNDPRSEALRDAAAAEGITGLGAGEEYMGNSTFHMDVYPLDRYSSDMGQAWGSWGNRNESAFLAAGLEGQGGQPRPTTGGSGQDVMQGGGGNDTLAGGEVNQQPTTLGQRLRTGVQSMFAGASNPTIAAERLEAGAERSRDRVDRQREIYNTNAPTSWLNVLSDTVGTLGANAMEAKADSKKQEAQEIIQSLMAGEITEEEIAEIMTLDPELGESLRQEMVAAEAAAAERAHSIAMQEDSQAHATGMQQSGFDFTAGQNELDRASQAGLQEDSQVFTSGENALNRETQFGLQQGAQEFTAGENALNRGHESATQEDSQSFTAEENALNRGIQIQTEIERDLKNQGLVPGTPEYQTAYEREMALRHHPTPTAVDPTTLEQNITAAGYTPGTPEYQARMDYLLDPNNAAEVQAARVAADAAATSADKFASTVGGAAGEAAMGLSDSAKQAASQLPQWQIARNAMDDFQSGTLAPTQEGVGRFLSSLGITDQNLQDYGVYATMEQLGVTPGQAMSMEIVERIVNEAIIGKIGSGGTEGGFPANNFSNADLAFLQTSVPNLTDSSGGMRAKLSMLEWRDRTAIAKAEAWVDYQRQAEAAGDPINALDWEEFNIEWSNAPVNTQMQAEMSTAIALDRMSTGGIITPRTTEDYNAIPSGTRYHHPDDPEGVMRVKP